MAELYQVIGWGADSRVFLVVAESREDARNKVALAHPDLSLFEAFAFYSDYVEIEREIITWD